MAKKQRKSKAPAAPLAFSHAEVTAKARGLKRAGDVTERIRVSARSKPIGKLRSAAAAPASLSAKDMHEIKRLGAPPEKIANRLARAARPEAATSKSRRRKKKNSPGRDLDDCGYVKKAR